MTTNPHKETSWEEEFDKLFFPKGDDFTSKLLWEYNDAVKQFISQEITKAQEEAVEKVIEYIISNCPNIDVPSLGGGLKFVVSEEILEEAKHLGKE